MFTLGMSKYAKELMNLGFSDRLNTTESDCKMYLEHCKKYNMKWLGNSYGTIVHKDFDKFFEYIDVIKKDKEYEIYQDLSQREKEYMFYILDHKIFLKFKNSKDDYMITSSPYKMLDVNVLNALQEYPYNVYIIHPNFLNYYGFLGGLNNVIGHPLYEVTYAFTTVDVNNMHQLNLDIQEETGIYEAFVPIK